MPDLFNIAELGVTFIVGGFVVGVLQRIALTNRLAGTQKPVTAPKPVQARRANRLDADLTGRERWVDGGADAAVAMRERRRVLHLSTQEIEIHAAAVAASTDWSAVERALSGQPDDDDVPPLFRATRALLTPTGAYPTLGGETNPWDRPKPSGPPPPPRPKLHKRKKHAHGGAR